MLHSLLKASHPLVHPTRQPFLLCNFYLSNNVISITKDSEGLSEGEWDLKNLKEQLNDEFPVGPLIKKCCTLDQV